MNTTNLPFLVYVDNSFGSMRICPPDEIGDGSNDNRYVRLSDVQRVLRGILEIPEVPEAILKDPKP